MVSGTVNAPLEKIYVWITPKEAQMFNIYLTNLFKITLFFYKQRFFQLSLSVA